MSADKQVCPICGAANTIDAKTCAICGTWLKGRVETRKVPRVKPGDEFYDPAMGEDDLLAARALGRIWLTFALLLLGLLAAGGIFVAFTQFQREQQQEAEVPTPTAPLLTPSGSPLANSNGSATAPVTPLIGISAPTLLFTVPPTNTRPVESRVPPVNFPTITPTVSLTPTPGPCMQTVKAGDTLYGLALSCGHVDLSIVDVIVEANGLASASALQVGQVIEIPRPTPTFDPNATPVSSGDIGGGSDVASAELSADDIVATRVQAAEPTLDPNLMYHTIATGQTLYDIVAMYEIDVKLLSEINPEMDFPQCDFGVRFGGETCAVIFSVGQRIRVPAPTRTPTIPPSPSGSETPTPSPTATFNVPGAFTPADGAEFDASQAVALRWTSTGTLGIDEVYVVRVTNRATNTTYIGLTCDQRFDLPMEWQPAKAESQLYNWSVSVGNIRAGIPALRTDFVVRATPIQLCAFSFALPVNWQPAGYTAARDIGVVNDVTIVSERYPTSPRRFFWQGRG